jgi:hypothetical protein
MIKDWNNEILDGAVFHFKNSLRPFISVYDENEDETLFIDLHNFIGYHFDDLEYNELNFYTKNDDEDFKGVDVVETLNY